jgi:hypothetical protein
VNYLSLIDWTFALLYGVIVAGVFLLIGQRIERAVMRHKINYMIRDEQMFSEGGNSKILEIARGRIGLLKDVRKKI